MLPVIPKPRISIGQKRAAIAVAGFADLLQVVIFPAIWPGAASPLEDVVDVVTATILIAICGFKWQFILAFLLELVPFADLFPTWTAVVLLLPTHSASATPAVNTLHDQRVTVTPAGSAPHTGDPRQTDVVDVEAVVLPPVQSPPLRRP